MPEAEIIIRFVTCDDPTSVMIRAQAGVCMPFTPSHTEALSRDGQHWTGQHIDGGCQARPLNYYDGEPNMKEARATLGVTQTQHDAFHDFLEKRIGDPYDWRAILGFALPDLNLHEPGGAICSALMELTIRSINFFPWPLTVPAHHISPRDLMLILSAIVEIDH